MEGVSFDKAINNGNKNIEMKEREIRTSLFYTLLNNLLRSSMPCIRKQIEGTIQEKSYKEILKDINCSLEEHPWGQVTQWRIEFMSEEYDETLRPHSFGGFISIEEVEGLKTLHFESGRIYNTFIDEEIKKKIKFHYEKAGYIAYEEPATHDTNKFLERAKQANT